MEYLAKIERLMDEHGWAVQLVGAGDGEPEFGYTVGMFRLEHPEFIVFALPFDTMKWILNALGARVRDGERFSVGAVLSGVVRGHNVCLVDVTDPCEHLTVANALAGRTTPVPALQVVFQDADGRWPWDTDWRFASVCVPLLGPVPPLEPALSPPAIDGSTPEIELGGYLTTMAVADDAEPLSCVRHPRTGAQEVLVRLIPDEDDYPGVDLEALWAEPLGDDRWRIVSVPYYAYGLSVGDTVTTTTDEVGTWAVSIVGRGGHSTLRCLAAPSDKDALWAVLEEAGARCDQSNVEPLFAVDIPPDVSYAVIDAHLDENCAGEYEEACLQHLDVADSPSPTLPEA